MATNCMIICNNTATDHHHSRKRRMPAEQDTPIEPTSSIEPQVPDETAGLGGAAKHAKPTKESADSSGETPAENSIDEGGQQADSPQDPSEGKPAESSETTDNAKHAKNSTPARYTEIDEFALLLALATICVLVGVMYVHYFPFELDSSVPIHAATESSKQNIEQVEVLLNNSGQASSSDDQSTARTNSNAARTGLDASRGSLASSVESSDNVKIQAGIVAKNTYSTMRKELIQGSQKAGSRTSASSGSYGTPASGKTSSSQNASSRSQSNAEAAIRGIPLPNEEALDQEALASWKFNEKQDLQLPELPTGCEATALSTLLRMHGVDVTKQRVANAMPKTADGSDFVNAFWGDPYSEDDGWACMAPCVVSTAKRLLHGTGLTAEDKTGTALTELKLPATIWVTIDMEEAWMSSYEQDGYQLAVNTHCVVLKSIDNGQAQVVDPLVGETSYDLKLVQEAYDAMGQQAVYIHVKDKK